MARRDGDTSMPLCPPGHQDIEELRGASAVDNLDGLVERHSSLLLFPVLACSAMGVCGTVTPPAPRRLLAAKQTCGRDAVDSWAYVWV